VGIEAIAVNKLRDAMLPLAVKVGSKLKR